MVVLPLPAGPVMNRLRRELATRPRVCTLLSGNTKLGHRIAHVSGLDRFARRALLQHH